MTQILIVDDHADIRRLLSVTLGKRFSIVEAEDGLSAMDVIRRDPPQLVLLDVMMPGEMDGLAVLDAIKGDPKTRHILVAMLTARGQEKDGEDARARGADAYFVKPFSPLQVVNWVKDKLQAST
ncbi:response regulator [Rhodoferax sp. 4810]|nr:response regulator [Rhodoferax jenense]